MGIWYSTRETPLERLCRTVTPPASRACIKAHRTPFPMASTESNQDTTMHHIPSPPTSPPNRLMGFPVPHADAATFEHPLGRDLWGMLGLLTKSEIFMKEMTASEINVLTRMLLIPLQKILDTTEPIMRSMIMRDMRLVLTSPRYVEFRTRLNDTSISLNAGMPIVDSCEYRRDEWVTTPSQQNSEEEMESMITLLANVEMKFNDLERFVRADVEPYHNMRFTMANATPKAPRKLLVRPAH